MKFSFILATLFSTLAFSQQTANKSASNADLSTLTTKVVRVRYGNPERIAELVAGGLPITVKGDNSLRAIVLKGAPNLIASVEQTIRELDVPAAAQASKTRDVELVVSVIGGSDKNGLLPESQISEANAPVVKQLRAVFPYKSYQLLSSMLLRSRDGGTAGSSGVMKSLGDLSDQSYPSGYSVVFDEVSVSPEQGKSIIYVRKFHFSTKVPIVMGKSKNSDGNYSTTQYQNSDVSIVTDVHLQEGQKIVVGKANIDNSDLALFVVLTARLVE